MTAANLAVRPSDRRLLKIALPSLRMSDADIAPHVLDGGPIGKTVRFRARDVVTRKDLRRDRVILTRSAYAKNRRSSPKISLGFPLSRSTTIFFGFGFTIAAPSGLTDEKHLKPVHDATRGVEVEIRIKARRVSHTRRAIFIHASQAAAND